MRNNPLQRRTVKGSLVRRTQRIYVSKMNSKGRTYQHAEQTDKHVEQHRVNHVRDTR